MLSPSILHPSSTHHWRRHSSLAAAATINSPPPSFIFRTYQRHRDNHWHPLAMPQSARNKCRSSSTATSKSDTSYISIDKRQIEEEMMTASARANDYIDALDGSFDSTLDQFNEKPLASNKHRIVSKEAEPGESKDLAVVYSGALKRRQVENMRAARRCSCSASCHRTLTEPATMRLPAG